MTLATTAARIQYTGTGYADTFPYPFRIAHADDLVVSTRTSGGIVTVHDRGPDYTVTGVGSVTGGTVVFTTPPAVSVVVDLRRVVDIVQATDIRNQGAGFPAATERELDYCRMIDQQHEDTIRRSVRLADTLNPDDYSLTLPEPVIGAAIVWGAGGVLTTRLLTAGDSWATSVYNVLSYGAIGDGLPSSGMANAIAFAACNNDMKSNGGGAMIVPYTSAGYVIGDGVTAGTGIECGANCMYLGIGGRKVRLVHLAVGSQGNDLFTMQDLANVTIAGFTIDGGSAATRRAVLMRGVVSDLLFEDLYLYDFADYAGAYEDARLTWTDAHYDRVTLRRVTIDGQVSSTPGVGSGLRFYARTERTGDDGTPEPGGRHLSLEYCDLDVTGGSLDQSLHGSQALEVDNCRHVTVLGGTYRGGRSAALTLTNGVQHARVVGASLSCANRGVRIDAVAGSALTTRSQDIQVIGGAYRKDGVTGAGVEGYGGTITTGTGNVSITGFDTDGSIVLLPARTDETLTDVTIDGVTLRGAEIIASPSDPTGGAVLPAPAAAWPAITGLTIRDIRIVGADGLTTTNSAGRIVLGDGVWWWCDGAEVSGVAAYRATADVVHVYGTGNLVEDVTVHDGNPLNTASRAAVFDSGIKTTVRRVALLGTHFVKNHVRKTGGEGGHYSMLSGTAGDVPVHLANQEAGDGLSGDVTRTGLILDLSSYPATAPLFTAEEDYCLVGIEFAYTEASSAAAGVAVQVGRISTAGVSTTYFHTATSASAQAQGTVKRYLNTTGTDSLAQQRLPKGDTLTYGTAGLKSGAGEITVTVHLVRVMTP
jgi:hypothetical protein